MREVRPIATSDRWKRNHPVFSPLADVLCPAGSGLVPLWPHPCLLSGYLDPMDCSLTRLLCPWGFSRQEYWSALPLPPPGDLPDPGIEPGSPALQVDAFPFEPPGKLIPHSLALPIV